MEGSASIAVCSLWTVCGSMRTSASIRSTNRRDASVMPTLRPGLGAGILVEPANARPRPVAREPRAGAIRARHVDDRDSVGRAAGVGKGGERGRQDGEVVVRDDGDVDVGGERSRQSRVASH